MNCKQDDRVETVLTALQLAEPDDAMQDRILLALQAAEAEQTTYAGDRRWPNPAAFSNVAAPWFAAAALLLAAGGTLLLHRHGLRDTHPDQGTQLMSAYLGGKTPSYSKEDSSSINERPALTFNSADTGRIPHVSQRHGIRLQIVTEAYVSEARLGTPGPDDVADDRSFPAPPLPLTEQERLLLRLVHREPPQQVAQLTSAVQNTGFQHEKDAVTEFFAPLPSLRGQQEPPSYVAQTGQQ